MHLNAKRFARGQRGATTVEFAIISMVLFAVICGVIELALILFAQSSLEDAAREASRYGITEQPNATGNRDGAILAKAKAQLPHLLDPTKLTLKTLIYNDFSSIGKAEPFTDTNGNGVYDAGEPFKDVNGNKKWDADQGQAGSGGTRSIVLYDLLYTWNPQFGITRLFHLTPINLSARIVVRNEP